ncbi:MAG: hypothetical protein D6734_09410 [Candidatus Schekmanbacteria bacterium]|nr:MAG: hypothetical protein D6734_09410 [Candidatus Schekmanbacteria bacterium]
MFLIILAVVLLMRLIFSWLDMSFILGRIVDDAFYYFQTARNIVKGLGSTFDGINPTNGYHPLWMLCILPIFYFTKSSPELSIHFVMTLQVVILAGIILLFGKIIYEKFGKAYAVIALAIFIWPRFLSQTEYGLEAGLLIFLLFVTVYFSLKSKIFSSYAGFRQNFLFGIILGFVFLARLDSIFLIAAIAVYLFLQIFIQSNIEIQKRINIFFKKSFTLALPVILIAFPYLTYNYLKFGHIVTISGSLKHSFPVPHFFKEYFFEFKEFSIIFFLALFFLIFILLRKDSYISFCEDNEYSAISTIFALYVILHFADTIFFMKWAVFRWHFAGYVVFLILISPLIVDFLSEASKKMLKIEKKVFLTFLSFAFLVGAILSQMISVSRGMENKFQYNVYEEALWVKDNTKKEDVLMIEDAGILGYFSDRRVVNIDGVINNFELQEYFKEGKFVQYIKDKGIKYFAHHAFWNSPTVREGTYKSYLFRSFSHLYDKWGGDLVLEKKDEIYRSKEYNHFGDKTVFIIWKINY